LCAVRQWASAIPSNPLSPGIMKAICPDGQADATVRALETGAEAKIVSSAAIWRLTEAWLPSSAPPA